MRELNDKTLEKIDTTIEHLKRLKITFEEKFGAIVDLLIDDIEDIKNPTGPFSYWFQEGHYFWGDPEWYRRHPLQPIGDEWHGKKPFDLSGDLQNRTLLTAIQNIPELLDPDYSILRLYKRTASKDFQLFWNQVGIILMSSRLFVNSEWFIKNWYYKEITNDEENTKKIIELFPNYRQWIEKYFKPGDLKNGEIYLDTTPIIDLQNKRQAVLSRCKIQNGNLFTIKYCINNEGDNTRREDLSLEIKY